MSFSRLSRFPRRLVGRIPSLSAILLKLSRNSLTVFSGMSSTMITNQITDSSLNYIFSSPFQHVNTD